MRKRSVPLAGLAGVQDCCINYAIISTHTAMKTGKGVISTLYSMSYDVMGITQASVQGFVTHYIT